MPDGTFYELFRLAAGFSNRIGKIEHAVDIAAFLQFSGQPAPQKIWVIRDGYPPGIEDLANVLFCHWHVHIFRPWTCGIANRSRDIPVLLENKVHSLTVAFGSFARAVFANFFLRAGDTSHAFFIPFGQRCSHSTMPIGNCSRLAIQSRQRTRQ